MFIGHSNAVKIADAVEAALVLELRNKNGDMTVHTMNKIARVGRTAALQAASCHMEEPK